MSEWERRRIVQMMPFAKLPGEQATARARHPSEMTLKPLTETHASCTTRSFFAAVPITYATLRTTLSSELC